MGSSFHDQGSNLGPLQWKHRVLINNLPGFMVFRILVNTFYIVVEFSFCSSFFFFFPLCLKNYVEKYISVLGISFQLTWYAFKDRGAVFVKKSEAWRNGYKGSSQGKFCTGYSAALLGMDSF